MSPKIGEYPYTAVKLPTTRAEVDAYVQHWCDANRVTIEDVQSITLPLGALVRLVEIAQDGGNPVTAKLFREPPALPKEPTEDVMTEARRMCEWCDKGIPHLEAINGLWFHEAGYMRKCRPCAASYLFRPPPQPATLAQGTET